MNEFDDIRPYDEDEIPAAMQRIAQSEAFPLIASYVYPDEPLEKVREKISSFKTVKDFQYDTMYKANEQIIKRSITSFTCAGIENLERDKNYVFISNHRDIMLDSSLLQHFLVTQGFDTTEITFGSNLMMSPLVIDIGKSNKMFVVKRPDGNMREFYKFSLHLSKYIRYVITEKKQSIWIAQRNGRTKDGRDHTDQGIIKMFCMSLDTDRVKALIDLNIVPVCVSYENEPCDVLKALELYESQYTRYTKKPGEDLTSILTGIMQPKGRVHFEICKPISPAELTAFETLTNNTFHQEVAKIVDKRINMAYKHYPNNYIAHDMLYGNKKFAQMYSDIELAAFAERLKILDRYDTCDLERLREIFLSIYSNPLDNF